MSANSKKAVRLSTVNDRLVVRLGYDAENFAEDMPKLKSILASKGFSEAQIASLKLQFADDPNIINGGNADDRGFQAEVRPYSLVWVNPQSEELTGKSGRAYFRARARLVESELGTTPLDMVEVVNSKTEPEFFSLEDATSSEE